MKSFGFTSSILNYTRELKQSRSIIYNLFTNLNSNKFKSSVLKTAISDHHAVMGVLQLFKEENDNVFYFARNYFNTNIQ